MGQVVLAGLVDSSASLLVDREAQGESEGAFPEVQVVGGLRGRLPSGPMGGLPGGPGGRKLPFRATGGGPMGSW